METSNSTPGQAERRSTRSRDERRMRSRRHRLTIVLGGLGFLVLGGGGVGAYFAGTTAVPEASRAIAWNEAAAEACAPFEAARLTCAVALEVTAETPAGELISQSLPASDRVAAGTGVELTYSAGPESSLMPDLTGKSLEQAKEILYGVGVVIAGVEDVPSAEATVGDVLRTSVEPGTELRNGGEVTLFVGASTVVVPDWTGLTRERVTEAAAALALEVTFVEEESEAPVGTVVGQTPEAGEAVGSAGITVTVAKAFEAARAAVPDVVGLLPNEAQNALAQAGFRDIRTVVIKNAEVTSEQVTQVVPGEGEEAALEAPLVLIVSQPQ